MGSFYLIHRIVSKQQKGWGISNSIHNKTPEKNRAGLYGTNPSHVVELVLIPWILVQLFCSFVN